MRNQRDMLPARPSPPVVLEALRAIHPDAHCELVHASPFQLLCATVMSAQTTDVAVNAVTPALFAAFPDAQALAKASQREVEDLINRIGMFRQKAKNIIRLSQLLIEQHRGVVPASLDALVALPGVGRKTANVVLGVIFNRPEGVVVDTHVSRIAQRLGWTQKTTPEDIERDLGTKLPRDVWNITSHTLIFHGRRVCFARKPNCEGCGVSAKCASAFSAENVGRKAPMAKPRSAKASTAKASAAKVSTAKVSTAKASTAKASTVKVKAPARTSKKSVRRAQ
jgi:endonuclease III